MHIIPGDLDDPRVIELLRYHLKQMHVYSPPGSVFALDLSDLKKPEITFLAAVEDDDVLGVGALHEFSAAHGEIKSMRTHPDHLRQGVARTLLEEIVSIAKARNYSRLSLETGSGDAFEPALELYRQYGFLNGDAFAEYEASAFNQFMHLELAHV